MLLDCLITGSTIWLVYQWIWFGGCGIGVFVLSVTSFFSLFFCVQSLLRCCNIEQFREEANIFVSSLAMTYITYLSWNALASNPDEECNPFTESGANSLWQILAGVVVTGATVVSIATASVSAADKNKDNKKSLGNDLIAEEADGEAKADNEANAEAAIFPVTVPTLIFQGVMLLTCFYYAMLFTNWGSITFSGVTDDVFDASAGPMWIKIINQWLAIAFFTVSIALPICCPDRII